MTPGVKLSAMPWNAWTGMDRLLAALNAQDGDTRVVGGAVRDTLLDLPVADVDLATRLLPSDVVSRLEEAGIKAVPTGLAHGTITAVIGGKPIEVTTLRRDVETDGRHAVVAFTDDWRTDAGRRDFTINALTANPMTGEVIDYFDGLDDLAARRVRFIGDPLVRIAEDHLRILRFFRFHARFGAASLDADGLAACEARVNDLLALSRERIADELLKLLTLPMPAATVAIMRDIGIFAAVLPEVDADGVDTLSKLVDDEARLGIAPDPLRRLAALLPADAKTADIVGARLRMSKSARARIRCVASRNGQDATMDTGTLAYRIGVPCARDRMLLVGADESKMNALDRWTKPKLPIGGGVLISRGMVPGPAVADRLRDIEEAWIDAGFPDGPAFEALVTRHMTAGLRSSQ